MQDHTVRYVVNRANLSDPLVCLGYQSAILQAAKTLLSTEL